jgi:hypothetical protein
MSRRQTPWQRGFRAGTSRGFVRHLVPASLVLGVFSLLFGAAPVAADTASISYTVTGIVGANGWFQGSTGGDYVVVHWTVNVPVDQIQSSSGCEVGGVRVDGPTTGMTKTCAVTLTDNSQLSKTTSPIKIDNQPPTSLAAGAVRPPDANGWYNHPVGINWSGTDAISGVAACTSLTYSGPDSGAAGVSGGCTDVAGNTSSSSFPFQYDATAPQLTGASVRSTDGANIVRWKSSSLNDVATISRHARGVRTERAVFDGAGAGFVDKRIQKGVEYRYTVHTVDQAGNASAVRTLLALPKVVPLRKIGYTPRAAGPPILSWPAKSGAAYYHVQLFRNGKRILAAWPHRVELALRSRWTWAGHRYRLAPAQYAWFAWAGFGPRRAAHYKLLGHSTFIIPAH